MSTKTTLKVPVSGFVFLLFTLLFWLSSTSFAMANGGGDCDNEITISGNAKKITANYGVSYAWKIKGLADNKGAKFFDNHDKLIVKLADEVPAGEKIIVTMKRRDYYSSFSGPARVKVYESKDGYNFTYNKTLITEVKSYYVEKMFTLDGDAKFIKLVNASSYNDGSPDFLVDALSYSFTFCNDHCPDGPEPGTPCDDNNSSTINDVINDNCECEGETISGGTFTVCSQIDESEDDAEEDMDTGNVSTTSGDLELVYDNSNGYQSVGMRFKGLNIPQGAIIQSAFIQFTADATVDVDPCNLNIYGEASDDATAFSATPYNISSRPKTSAYVTWSPEDWTEIGDNDEEQQTDDISTVIQEVVNRGGYSENSAIAIIIDGIEGKRTAESYDGSDSHAPILCITYQTIAGCHDSDNDGVCNEDDLCEGFDDNIDVDNDGIPDGCDDCLNEEKVSGNAKKVLWNCGVSWAGNILGAPDGQGAKFFDNNDKMIVKLDDVVDKDQKIYVTLKRRDYESSYDGPIQLKVYESKHGYCWSYNKTIITEVKSYYVEKKFTVDGDTKYLLLVNGSTCYNGSPDFLVDAISYDYTLCDEDNNLDSGGSAQGMSSDNPTVLETGGLSLGKELGSGSEIVLTPEDIENMNIEDVPEVRMVTPNSVNVFPIPASRDLNVDLADHVGRTARISVFNQIGQLQEIIDVEEVTGSPVELNVVNYLNGAYYMTIEIENAQTITKKFIVNKSH